MNNRKYISPGNNLGITFDFHVSNHARNKYKIEESLFSITGDLIIANFNIARIISGRINEIRKSQGSNQLTTAGQLNALGLIHEIFHYLIRLYENDENPGVFSRGLNFLTQNIGKENLDSILFTFTKEFSPLPVFQRKISAQNYLEQSTGLKSNKEIILEEIILLYLENSNQATPALEELYNNKPLKEKTAYLLFIEKLEYFFSLEKSFGKENLSLISFLKKPLLETPYNIEGQLEYIREKWSLLIKDLFLDRLLSGKDLITEDLRLFIRHGSFDKPSPPVPNYDFNSDYYKSLKKRLEAGELLSDIESHYYNSEIEKFTQDIDWMPKVVMIAKNSYVWMDQLSKKYKSHITRLDQIPDEELDLLAKWNFTALWLIGIWERSSASRKIKQLTGNPDAAPSAYSLFDYVIAGELGGEDAFQNLKHRAALRGIRLASDMVPNHTGIYSKWIIEKPDYFIQSDYPPFPNYTFYSPNLSDDYRVEVRIEDRYYSREDAAVVFQRKDSQTGSVKYIYHGNDGTHMPWNDTAQLNLLNPEVRESLIQTILHVARKFPIIRFDAAMTLAKKHYQRLWFPQPGTGGAIPSRSDYSMTRQGFDDAMPEEFWREVVDRINKELPSTLLLAEAFWLMEGYFVRTLGMHRVYNSAFMHMLMKEENNKYRELIKNTLDFNPEILKRYVNFMSNPDEETAVNQFGKGDKYFGVAMLMITLPGLPMFAHGQIEGFSEKYGMEYKRAYLDEFTDDNLVNRHESELFPLMKKRYLFSQVNDFEFYDFITDSGSTNENVFAYTNRSGNERVLIVYNNAYTQCSGMINLSVIKKYGSDSNSNEKRIIKIADALQINSGVPYYYICKEQRTGMEYLFSGKEVSEEGIYFSLSGYEYKVLMNFEIVFDTFGNYSKIYQAIKGVGIPSINQRLYEMKLAPLHESLYYLFSKETFQELAELAFNAEVLLKANIGKGLKFLPQLRETIANLVHELNSLYKINIKFELVIDYLENDLINLNLRYNNFKNIASLQQNSIFFGDFTSPVNNSFKENEFLFIYIFLNRIQIIIKQELVNTELFEDLMLRKGLIEIFKELGQKVENIFEDVSLIQALLTKNDLIARISNADSGIEQILVSELIDNKDVIDFLLLNEFENIIYFNKERFEKLVRWILLLSLIKNDAADLTKLNSKLKKKTNNFSDRAISIYKTYDFLINKSAESGYRLNTFKELINSKAIETEPRIKQKKVKDKSKAVSKPIRRKKKNN